MPSNIHVSVNKPSYSGAVLGRSSSKRKPPVIGKSLYKVLTYKGQDVKARPMYICHSSFLLD